MNNRTVEGYKLSPQQKHLWLIQGDGRDYRSQCAVRLAGELDVRALECALREVVAQHEILRTTFECLPGMYVPVQVIASEPLFAYRTIEASTTERESFINEVLSDEADQHLDFAVGPLTRFCLISFSPTEHALLITLSALCGDAQSALNLINEIGRGYEALLLNRELASEPLQYADYSEWQNELLTPERGAASREYWRQQGRAGILAAKFSVNTLKSEARDRSVVSSIEPRLAKQIAAVSNEEGVSTAIILLTGWSILLWRLAEKTAFTLKVFSDNRQHEELQEALGLFARYLPVRCHLEDELQFSEVLALVNESLTIAQAHQDYYTWEQEDTESNAVVQDLLPVGFEFRTSTSGGHWQELIWQMSALLGCSDRFALRLEVSRSETGLELALHFDEALISSRSAETLLNQLEALLTEALTDSSRSISRLSLLGAGERRQVLEEFNRTEQEWAGYESFVKRFEAQVKRTPERLAVVSGESALSYEELNRRAEQLAAVLRGSGVRAEAVVGLCLGRRVELLVGVVGVLKAGGAYLVLDGEQPVERLRRMLGVAQPVLVVCGAGQAALLAELDWPVLNVDEELVAAGPAVAEVAREAAERQLVYLMFTSGSTGFPHAVMIEEGGLFNLSQALSQALGQELGQELGQALSAATGAESAGAERRVSLNAPMYFDASVKQLLQLLEGATLYLVGEEVRRDPEELVSWLEAQQMEVLDTTPGQLKQLLAAGLGAPGQGRPGVVLVGGEALDEESWRALAGLPEMRSYNVYGPTECTVDASVSRIEEEAGRVVIGKPLGNVRLYVLDEEQEPVAVGMRGELYIGGAGVGRGYAGEAGLTAERFIADGYSGEEGARLYRSGDQVRWLAEGQVEYLGRVDEQVKVRGYRVELGEIAAVLREHEGVKEAVVVARGGGGAEVRLLGYVVGHTSAAAESSGAGGNGAGWKGSYRLPNGLEIAQQNRHETEYLYEEIFERESYLRHGVELGEGACVFDVGANIGLFTLWVQQRCGGARVYSFEPIAELYGLLEENVRRAGGERGRAATAGGAEHGASAVGRGNGSGAAAVKLYACGLGAAEGEERFTYYPGYSTMSGLSSYASAGGDAAVIKQYLRNAEAQGEAQAEELLAVAEEVLAGRLAWESRLGQVRRLSAVMREEGVEQIDLLKIDVQRAELEVLGGIEAAEWEKIGQVVLEVHDEEGGRGRAALVQGELRQRGYEVVVEQEALLAGTDRYMVYAVRPGRRKQTAAGAEVPRIRSAAPPRLSVVELQEHLRARLPEYMQPSALVLLNELPLTRQGKVDREQLPEPEAVGLREAVEAAGTVVEELLVGIWSEVLGVAGVGVRENFFELGGHSLLATQVMARVREVFQVEVALRRLFEGATVRELGRAIEAELSRGVGVKRPALAARGSSEAVLSYAQQRLWFLDQLEPGNAFYNVPVGVALSGAFAVAEFERSLTEVVRRHEVLRTRFETRGGEAVQVIEPARAVALPLIDLSGLAAATRAAEVARLRAEEAARPFDLARGPLLRPGVLRLGETEHIVLLTLHHIVSDGWSMNLLVQEVATLYQAYRRGEESPLAELAVQYADYAVWQREWLQGEVLAEQLQYWREQLGEELAVLELPADFARPAVQSYRGRQVDFALSAEVSRGLQELSRRESVTLFMTLLAGFAVLLSRYANQQEVVVGAPIAGRTQLAVESLIGFFVNTLVLRVGLEGNPSFEELLRRVREVTLGAYAHQEVPFEKLVEELEPQRDLSRTPLFQVVFMYGEQATGLSSLAVESFAEVAVRPLRTQIETAKFDLTLSLQESEGVLAGSVEYNSDLFAPETIARMLEHFAVLLAGVAADSEARVSALPLMSASERRQVVEQWHERVADDGAWRSVVEEFEEQVQRRGEATAVVTAGVELSYAELNARANQLARYLQRLGVRSEARVGLLLERSVELVVGVLGVLKAGAAYVPLEPNHPEERLAFMLADGEIAVVVSEQQLVARLPEAGVRVVCLDRDGELLAQESEENLVYRSAVESAAYVIYTSGSTGQPKGVVVSHGNLSRLFQATAAWFEFSTADVWTMFHSYAFDFSVWELWGALRYGGRLVVVPYWTSRSPADFYRLLVSESVTVLNQTPSAFRQLMQAEQEIGPSSELQLRLVIFGGEALELQSLQGWVAVHGDERPQLINMYGITETTVHVTYRRLREAEIRQAGGSVIGEPLADLGLYLLDGEMEPVPLGVAGEIYVSGAGLAQGYLKRAELTAERFVAHPFSREAGARLYRTGDLARGRSDGDIEYLGRIDEQVKIRGYRIELREIEAVVQAHGAVRECLVLARAERAEEKRLVAYVVSSAAVAAGGLVEELRRYCREQLPDYMVPSVFVQLEALPLTSSGKVDRRALPAPDAVAPGAEELVMPRNEVEAQLAEIWREVLRLKAVGVHDNFFERGGDSILSIQIIARANQAGLRLTPKDLFQHQTIAELAAVARQTGGKLVAAAALPSGPLPLLPIQQYFFAQQLTNAAHFNQAVLLAAERRLEWRFMEASVARLLREHDALRLRFSYDAERSQWQQQYAEAGAGTGTDGSLPLLKIDLSALAAGAEQARALAEAGTQLQASLDIEAGPLLRVGVFELGAGEPQRLLWCIHHLAVDGVSWRILLADWQEWYEQAERGDAEVPAVHSSFYGNWALALQRWAQSEEAESEAGYWLEWDEGRPLPVDHGREGNTVASQRSVVTSLSMAQTEALLQQAPAVYHTRINDLLLTALGRAFGRWSGIEQVLIEMEGHGRESLESGAEELELTRTVGWCTSLYPLRLSANLAEEVGAAIKRTKEELRGVPRQGLSYGAVRYLSEKEELRERLAVVGRAEVSFNYLGQLDQALPEQGWLHGAGESSGASRDESQQRSHLLDIMSSVQGGRLQVVVSYSSAVHERASVERLLESYRESLVEVVEHCTSQGAGGYTPSDFPQSGLSQEQLDAVVGPVVGRREVEDVYVLSPMQEGLLFHALYAPQSAVYFEQVSCRLEGQLAVESFRRAWAAVIGRHSVLRSRFVWEGVGQAVQVVEREVELPWVEEDWRGLSGAEQEQRLEVELERDRAAGFELGKAPLMRVTLLRLEAESYELIWSHHHLVLDGWSLPVLLREVTVYYEGYTRGEEVELGRSRGYGEYIRWLQRQDLGAAEAYWREQLRGFTATTRLGIEAGGTGQEAGAEYEEQRLNVTAETSNRLQQLSRTEQVTLNTIVQGAWGVLMSRYSGESDVVFGATVSGRPAELVGVETMVGNFINTLPVRVQVKRAQTAKAYLSQLQAEQLETRQYEYSPLVSVQSWSEVPAGEPLFDTLLLFENYPREVTLQQLGGRETVQEAGEASDRKLEVSRVRNAKQSSYPMTVAVMPQPELLIEINYNTRRYEAEAIGRMLGHLEVLLKEFAADSARPIVNLPLLTTAEHEQLLAHETAPEWPAPHCLHQLFETQVSRTPEALAISHGTQQLSYQELNEKANQLAHYLRRLGVGAELRVAVCMSRSPQLLVAVLGVLKAGGAYLPLDAGLPLARMSFMLEDSGAAVLLTEAALVAQLPSFWGQTIAVDEEWQELAKESVVQLESEVTAANLAYMIYTSGSTGVPKGVMLTHGGACNLARTQAELFETTGGSRVLQFASLSFDASVSEIFVTLSSGGALVLAEREELAGEALGELLAAQQVTTVTLPPSVLSSVPYRELPRLATLVVAGEASRAEVMEQWTSGRRVLNAYGPTEATVCASAWEWESGARPLIGSAIKNAELYVLDGEQELAPVGVRGELYIGGAGLARGYAGRAELTAEKFIAHPFSGVGGERLYRSGDLVRRQADGELEFLGRIDEQVKVRGYRIELGEVEAALRQHAQVREAVVVLREGAAHEQQLVAYMVTEDGAEASTSELRMFLKEQLPDYMVPAAFVVLDELPLTTSGKVDRRALPAPDAFALAPEQLVMARTPVEELLMGVWANVLSLEHVAVQDNFFELGGHSLLAAQIVSRVRDVFGVELPLRSVFEMPVLSELAAELQRSMAAARAQPAPAIERAKRDKDPPLSFAQQRLWFLDQLEPHNSFYNIPLAVQVSGPFTLPLLKRSLEEIVRRHEVLRTIFSARDGQAVQIIATAPEIALPLIDLSTLAEAEGQRLVQLLSRKEAASPFDLAHGPLLRTTVLRLSPTEHIVLLSMHHIISDWWSMNRLVKEIATLYVTYSRGEESPLAELAVQYADYAVWQREWLQGEVLAEQLQYWREQLGEELPVLELPTDFQRPAVQSYRGSHVEFVLPAEVSRQLQEFSRRESVTLFMTLLAGFAVLLSRYANQREVVIGAPIAGRTQLAVESLIGFFVNTLVMRVGLEGDPSFVELLRRVREVTLGAYAHQEVPFEKLVEELQPERNLSRSPLFDVMFVWQEGEAEPLALPDLTFAWVKDEGGERSAKFDLTLTMQPNGKQLHGVFEYKTELFQPETIKRMVEHFQVMLAGVVDHPEWKLSQATLMSGNERQLILEQWNDTRRDYEKGVCLHELFERQTAARPQAEALISGEVRISYAELNRRANQMAHYLRALGVGPEARVGVMLERSIEMVVSLLGILKAGAAYVPIDPDYPPERLAFMLADAEVDVLVTESRLREALAGRLCKLICPDTDWGAIATEGAENPAVDLDDDNLAYVIYTSGSTGLPKGVMVHHAGVVNCLRWMQDTYGLDETDKFLFKTSLNFDPSVWELFWTLWVGATVCIAKPGGQLDNAYLVQQIVTHDCTSIYFVPSMLRVFLDEDGVSECRSLKRVICGGESLAVETMERFFRTLPAKLHHSYGPTEACIAATEWTCEPQTRRSIVPIGYPLANTQIYILDNYQQPVPIGVPGELYIGGVHVARGYHNRPELTAERFVADPFSDEPGVRLYRTGDLARYLSDGSIEYRGRVDYQIKIRGLRIELGEVEAVLRLHPQVSEAVVVARADSSGNKQLVVYLTSSSSGALAGAELRSYLQAKLPAYMIPAAFVQLAELPLTPGGKLDRRALPAAEFGSEVSFGVARLRTPVEELLVTLWSELLPVQQVSVTDNFFELGGHSLLATQLVSRLRQTLGVEVALRQVFETATVEQLARVLEQQLRGAGAPVVPAIERRQRSNGEAVLSYAQQRLWFLDQLEPGNAFYNVPLAVLLRGAVSLAALQRSLTEIVRRHEVLRTRFETRGGEAVQVIEPARAIALPLIDLSGLAAAARAAEAARLRAAEAARPFDLAQGPVLRPGVLRLGEKEHIVLLTLHHIVSDGWSMNLLVQEVATLYQVYSRGEESGLAELPVQYADYAEWQREWLQGEVLAEQLQYWREQLGEELAVLELPADFARPAVQSYRGARVSFALGDEVGEQLRRLSRRESVTLFMTLLAGWAVLLSRYAGQREVVVGTDIAGRTQGETELLIGFFVNQLVLRLRVERGESFRELLGQVREVSLGAYAHQEVPFEQLVEELKPARELSRTPLFQVKLVLQNTPVQAVAVAELELSWLGGAAATARFDMTLFMQETGAELGGVLEYNPDLYEEERMERLAAHLRVLLSGIGSNAEQLVGELGLLTEGEREQLLVEWQVEKVSRAEEQCLHQLFAAQAGRQPEAEAVVAGGERLSYGELERRANQVAHYLRRVGVRAEMLVGHCMEPSALSLVTLLGVLKAGGAYVPLAAGLPLARLSQLLADSGAAVVVTEGRLVGQLPSSWGQTVVVDEEWEEIARESEAAVASEVGGENLAYVLYTSGSTGVPKGVMVEHQAVVNYLSWAREQYELGAGGGALLHSSLSFDLTVTSLWGPLISGSRVVIVGEGGIEELVETLEQERGLSLVKLTPAHLVAVAGLSTVAEVSGAVRVVVVGGEALQWEQVRWWQEVEPAVRLINEYGPTEATVGCSSYEVSWGEVGSGSGVGIGRGIWNTELYVLDEEQELAPVGVSGELYIGGAGLARGYLGRAELTAEKFIAHPFSGVGGERLYRSGDLVRRQGNGELEFLGRLDEQVKVRGYRVELGEVESVLRQHAQVSGVVVVVRAVGANEKQLVAYVVGRESKGEQLEQELREYLKERLPEYMVPGVFVVLEELPLTASGKVDRRALPAPELVTDATVGFSRLLSPVEELLIALWSDLLEVKQVSVNDNFFELGGHSLLATQLISRLRQTLGVEISLRQVFEAPTVEQLAPVAEQQLRGVEVKAAPAIERAERDKDLPLSFAQQRLWFLDQLEPHNSFYNIPLAVQVSGAFALSLFRRSLEEIVRRHEVLRTTFAAVAGRAVQVIGAAKLAPLPLIDLSTLAEAAGQRLVQELSRAEAMRPFDLAHGPLLRTTVLRLSPTEHIVLVTMHHIITDGWSMNLLINEVARLYEAYSRGEESGLAELAVQYGDYAVWQREWLQGEVLAEQLQYWREQLGEELPVLELPTDFARPAVQSHRGSYEEFVLPAEVSRGLQELSRRESVTLFMTMLAAFAVLLSRYAGQSAVVVGTPVAGRSRSETEALIGFFVNTLVLRVELGGEPSFAELLGRVRETALGAYAHQELPFEKLVEALEPVRDLGRSPLFQVMFTLQQGGGAVLQVEELRLRPLGVESTTVKFDLSLSLTAAGAQVGGVLEYSADLFARGSMERLLGHWQALLAGVVEQAGQGVMQLPLLSAAERQELQQWESTGAAYELEPYTAELFARQAARRPEAVALVSAGARLSYGELEARANQLGHYLRREGVGAEVRVGVMCPRTEAQVLGLLGTLKAGGAYLPLDAAYPAERLGWMLADAQAPVLLTVRELAGLVPADYQGRVVYLDGEWEQIARQSEQGLEGEVQGETLAYLIYTSGSTGRPKAVLVEQGNLANVLQGSQQRFGMRGTDVMPCLASFAFDISLFELLTPLLAGGQVLLVKREQVLDMEELTAALRPVTLLHAVPTLMRQLVAEIEGQGREGWYGGLRQLFVGGDAVPTELLGAMQRVFPGAALEVLYGPTEATIICSSQRVSAGEEVSGRVIGRALPGMSVGVYEGQGELAPVGVRGEIWVSGAGVTRGYWQQEAETEAKYVRRGERRYYRTGDVGRWQAEGVIEFLGRIDEQVKVRGYRIELGEVEAVLRQHAQVRAAVVVVREVGASEKQLVAYVAGRESKGEQLGPELRGYLKEQLPEYMVPGVFVVLAELPLLSSGKVDRRALPAPDAVASGAEQLVGPRDEVEAQLAEIWREVLRLQQVSVHDNFFERGGDSILSIQIIARANQAGLRLTPKDLFQHQTIAELAAVAAPARVRPAAAAAEVPRGPLPLTPIQQYFFAQQVTNAAHFNQAVLLAAERRLEWRFMEASVARLLREHEALRLRFSYDGERAEWQQQYADAGAGAGTDGSLPLINIDLSALTDRAERAAAMAAAGTQLQASLDIEAGPLLRVGVFELGEGEPQRLLWCIHHLAVDGVSWRILLADWQAWYEQAERGEGELPALRTTSYGHWALTLQRWAQSKEAEGEAGYWLEWDEVRPLPVDYERAGNTVGSQRSVVTSLSPAQTEALLQQAPAVYHTRINDLLLTALSRAFGRWSGIEQVLIEMEGHGRELLESGAEELELTRTVGWFTSLYPLRLSAHLAEEVGAAIKRTKEELRGVPRQGLSYGAVRYLSEKEELRERLAAVGRAEVSFNYLGQLDQALPEQGWLHGAGESSGASRDESQQRSHLLDIVSSVQGGRLQLVMSYSSAVHERESIERLAESYRESLVEVVEHCTSEGAGGFTPSDFPLANISQKQLDLILKKASKRK